MTVTAPCKEGKPKMRVSGRICFLFQGSTSLVAPLALAMKVKWNGQSNFVWVIMSILHFLSFHSNANVWLSSFSSFHVFMSYYYCGWDASPFRNIQVQVLIVGGFLRRIIFIVEMKLVPSFTTNTHTHIIITPLHTETHNGETTMWEYVGIKLLIFIMSKHFLFIAHSKNYYLLFIIKIRFSFLCFPLPPCCWWWCGLYCWLLLVIADGFCWWFGRSFHRQFI